MANEQRLIDALPLMQNGWHLVKTGESNRFLKSMSLADVPTVDAVEASRLGYLGRLMMPYKGCPRGRMGARGDGRIIELDPIKDVEGDIWVPVLEEDLNFLKAKAVEVVHGLWENVQNGKGCCSNCHRLDSIDNLATHCRYCGAMIQEGE